MELTEQRHQKFSSFYLHFQFNNVSCIARLPREVWDAPNLVVLKARLDEALTAWSGGRCPCPRQGRVGTQWPFHPSECCESLISAGSCHTCTCSSTMDCAEEILLPEPEITQGLGCSWCCFFISVLFGSFCSPGFASGTSEQQSTRNSEVRSSFGHQITSSVFPSASYTLDIFIGFYFIVLLGFFNFYLFS